MAERSQAGISRSLAPLRDVVASLAAAGQGALPSANDRRKLVRRVRAAGSAALPALLRALASGTDGEARWASWLLQRVGPDERTRVAERVSRLLEDPRLSEEQRALSQSLLRSLHGPSEGTEAGGRDQMMAVWVDELLRSITVAEDVQMAVELVAREVPEDEVFAFASEVARRGGEQAGPLLDRMIEAGLQSEPTLSGLRALREGLEGVLPELTHAPHLPSLSSLANLIEPPIRIEPPRQRPHADSERGESSSSRRINRRDPRRLGVDLLERGELHRARAALTQAVAADPNDGEALSYLGVCVLQLGEPDDAMPYLERAAQLEPDEALHHWNVAAAAKAADLMCRGYLALERYLALPDEYEGHEARVREARRFLRSYEKSIAQAHPGVALPDAVEAERMFQRAVADIEARRFDPAAHDLRKVVALLPHHFASWGNLGAAELALGNYDEAARCLRRALELKPDYQVARDNLRLLETRH